MSGLLGALDGLSASASLTVTLDPQIEALGGISASVQVLADGPQALAELEAAIGAIPVPPALEGLGALAPALNATLDGLPTDFSGALSGLITPLSALSVSISASPAGQAMCMIRILREAIRLATGKRFGGPQPMPDGSGAPFPDLPDLAEIEAVIAEADAALDGLGPALDASRVLAFLQQVARQTDRVLVRFPPIPVLQDLTEALATVAHWQTLPGDTLTRQLAQTITTAARVIDLPHDRVVRARVAAAEAVAAGPATLSAVNAELVAVFSALRGSAAEGLARPARAQLDRLEQAAEQLEALARAMDPENSVLAQTDGLVCALVEARLLTLRTLQPQCQGLPFAAALQGWLDGLPPAQADTFAGILSEIEGFDLAALTDALTTIRQAVQDAVAEVNGARDAVRDAFAALLDPVADALDTAQGAAGLAEILSALDALPGQIEVFANDTITANLAQLRGGIATAVGEISAAADAFDPETLVAPIRAAIGEVGALVNDPKVKSTFQDVEHALDSAIEALTGFDLAPAADQSITLIGDIEGALEKIDPALIPDAAKPLIEQGVAAVTEIEFAAEVSAPLDRAIQTALDAGPMVVLASLEGAMDEARLSLEQFRPSQMIGETLDRPFTEAVTLLGSVSPDALFGRIEAALSEVQSRVQILDVGAVVDPLVEVHGTLAAEVEKLRPSTLLKPVDDALAEAIGRVYEASGIDDVFDGITGMLDEVNRHVGLIAALRDLMARVAAMLDAPGNAEAEIDAIVEGAVATIDSVDMAGLSEAFALAASAVQRNERDAIAGAIARSFRAAAPVGAGLGGHAELARLGQLLGSMPPTAAEALRHGEARNRLIAALTRLRQAEAALTASGPAWSSIAPRLEAAAGSIQLDLKDYHLAGRVQDRSVLESFATPPTTNAALKAEVRTALADGIGPPVRMILATFATLAPHAQVVVRGLSDILGAVHGRIDAITGAGGIGGTVQDVEAVVNLLREVDLSPVADPLDAIHARMEGALAAVSPAALRAPLEAARDAIAGLLDLSQLIDPADRAALNAAHAAVLAKLGALSPSKAIGEPLDAEYEALLGTILPILGLPGRLRTAVLETKLALSGKIIFELTRVEAAFDEMLRAIPLRTGVAVRVSASVSVG